MSNNFLIEKLRQAIEIDNNEVAAELIIQELGSSKVTEAVPDLVSLLKKVQSCNLRNNIALALADIGEQSALEPLMSLIKSKKTEGCRGTLIYALQSLDCSPILIDLVELVINGGFEVSCEAFDAIESVELLFPLDDIQSGYQKVELAIKDSASFPEEKIERLFLLRDYLLELYIKNKI